MSKELTTEQVQKKAQAKIKANKPLTWQEKMAVGLPLTQLEEVKADADFNYKERLEDEKRKKAFEAAKSGGAIAPSDDEFADDGGEGEN